MNVTVRNVELHAQKAFVIRMAFVLVLSITHVLYMAVMERNVEKHVYKET